MREQETFYQDLGNVCFGSVLLPHFYLVLRITNEGSSDRGRWCTRPLSLLQVLIAKASNFCKHSHETHLKAQTPEDICIPIPMVCKEP